MRRTLLAIAIVAALAAGACGSSKPHAAPDPTVATSPLPPPTTAPPSTTIPPTTTTTTAVPDTATVPQRITIAYVDGVLAKLNHVYGNAVRATVAAHRLTPQAIADLAAIYSPALAAEEQQIFRDAVNGGLKDIRKHPGDPVTKVVDLISASTLCIYAKVHTNADSAAVHPVRPPADEFLGLHRRSRGTLGVNSTPWAFFFDLTNALPTKVPDQCSNG